MRKNKEFSSTSSSRYSLALYELAHETNLLIKIEEQSLKILKLIHSSIDFSNLIKNPTSMQQELLNVINKIAEQYKFESLLKNFLNLLINKKRFFYLEQILKKFIEICSQKRGELKAEFRSAKNLSSEEIAKITNDLSKNFKSKIKLNYKQDKSLIGGLIVQVGSIMVDTSIKNKLQKIQNKMMEI